MKVKKYPCKDGQHTFTENYLETGGCGTPYCSWSEAHCRKCGWYIKECGCGFNNGVSKISHKQFRAQEKRHKSWEKKDEPE